MRNFYLGISLCLTVFLSNAQTIPTIQSPKSPEASSIEQAIEVPVSFYTGTSSISIPLFDIVIKGATVPISLNYSTGGVRVDQEATPVGLGWSLSCGGEISRSVKGKPDEYSFINAGRLNWQQYSIASYLNLPNVHQDAWTEQRMYYIHKAKDNSLFDYRPDEFYYSGQGFSGRFMYNQAQDKFVLFPKEDIKVDFTFSPTYVSASGISFYPIESWKLTLPTGTTMKYGLDGSLKSGALALGKAMMTDLWKIKEITTPYGESVTFSYTPVTYTMTNVTSDYYDHGSGLLTAGPNVQYTYEDALLQSITFPNGTVTFLFSDRQDLSTGSKAIQEMNVYNASGSLIRKVSFKYSYFDGSFGDIMPDVGYMQTSSIYYKRLRLDEVTITGEEGRSQTYKFDYITKQYIPSKRSFAQDIWGYFNGQGANKTWVPRVMANQEKFAVRSVNTNYSDVFSSKSITYPTGGKTEFEYEGNTAKANTSVSMLAQLDAPALVNNGWGISIYGGNRLEYGYPPTSTGSFGEKYFRRTFTIPPGGGFTAINGGFDCNSTYYKDVPEDNVLDCYSYNVDFILEKDNGNGTFTVIKSHRLRQCYAPTYVGGKHTTLPKLEPGTYRMSVVLWYVPSSVHVDRGHVTSFNVSWLENSTSQALQYINAGGTRIRKIKMLDSDGTILREKEYTYNTPGTSLTSGQIVSFPTFIQNYFGPGLVGCQFGGSYCTDIRIFGNPVYGIQTTAGSCLGYEYVTEKIKGATQSDDIVTQYWYWNTEPVYDQYYRNVQEGILEQHEWQRGKLRSVVMTKGGLITKSEIYEYNEVSPHLNNNIESEDYVEEINTDLISGAQLTERMPDFYDAIRTGIYHSGQEQIQISFKYGVDLINMPFDILSTLPPGTNINDVIPVPYTQELPHFKRYTGFDKLRSKTTTSYDDAGRQFVQTKTYMYGLTPSNHQLTRQIAIDGKGVQTATDIQYASHFSSTAPYTEMINRNMVSIPIQTTETVGSETVSFIKSNFGIVTNNHIMPTSFEASTGGNMETLFEYLAYDANGNPITLKKSNDVITNRIYGYNNQYVTAEAVNTTQADIAFTAFEAEGLGTSLYGNWQLTSSNNVVADITSPLGKMCFELAPSTVYLQKSGLTASREYILSYWSKNGSYTVAGSTGVVQGTTENGWTYYQHSFTGVTNVTIKGTGRIDLVNLHPKGVMMTTYTYKELVGVTSVTDPNNISTYYEYDDLGRLRYARDNKKNIIKAFEYNYSNGNN